MYVWLNGNFVGYAEDSFTPSEFDLTPYIKEGENVLAVEVHKMSTAAFLEDQDFFRFFGIFRNVCLKAIPNVHVEDVWFNPVLNRDNESGKLNVNVRVSSLAGNGLKARVILNDRENVCVLRKEFALEEKNGEYFGTVSEEIECVKAWDNHVPYLYGAYLEILNTEDEILEVIPYNIGFRRIEIIDKVMY